MVHHTNSLAPRLMAVTEPWKGQESVSLEIQTLPERRPVMEKFMAGWPAGLLTTSYGRDFRILVIVSNCEPRDRPPVAGSSCEISHLRLLKTDPMGGKKITVGTK